MTARTKYTQRGRNREGKLARASFEKYRVEVPSLRHVGEAGWMGDFFFVLNHISEPPLKGIAYQKRGGKQSPQAP